MKRSARSLRVSVGHSAHRLGKGAVDSSASASQGILRRAVAAVVAAAVKATSVLVGEPRPQILLEGLELRRMFDVDTNTTNVDIKVPETPKSTDPVEYYDGAPVITANDLSSSGFGSPFGQTRSFGASVGFQATGNNWTINELPYLKFETPTTPRILEAFGTAGGAPAGEEGNDTAIVMSSGVGGVPFMTGSNTVAPWIPYSKSRLVYTQGANTATVFGEDGSKTVFIRGASGTDSTTVYPFQSYTDPNGNVIEVTSRKSGTFLPVNIDRSSGSDVERWHYDYNGTPAGSLAGMLEDVQLQRSSNSGASFSVVREADYGYYTDASTQPGSLADLKSVIIKDGSGSEIGHTVYRYYTNDTNSASANFQSGGGNTGMLKFIFNGDSYARAIADGKDPTTMSDTDAKKYADFYYEYNGDNQVTTETVHFYGSSSSTDVTRGTFHYEYNTNSSENAGTTPNTWTNETTETLPDGTKNYVFMNGIGQQLLLIHTDADGNNQQGWFNNYDSNSLMTLAAQPSAVMLPPDAPSVLANYDDLLHNTATGGAVDYQFLSNDTGLIERRAYYSSTTATSSSAGGVTHELSDVYIQHGENGTLIPQENIKYKTRSVGSGTDAVTIPLPGSDTVYSDTAGAVPIATSYGYSFHNSTNLWPETVTTTFPTISTSHNGQGTSVTATQVDTYDTFGEMTQSVDPDGFVTKNTWDLPTGALVKYERDADNLDLTTNLAVDDLGRPKQFTDAKGNITYYTYDDVNRETRIYPGWHASGTNYTTTGPITIIKHSLPSGTNEAVFDETLTATMVPTANSVPTGAEAITAIQTLHREITDVAGQVTQVRDYFAFSGTNYAAADPGTASNDTASGSYHLTRYHYRDGGEADGLLAPTGTIERLVFDAASRVASVYIGTDDGSLDGGGSLGDFNPASAGNAVDVVDYAYDVFRAPISAPGSAPSVSQTTGTNAAETYYVTITYVGAHGESLASAETEYAVTGSTGRIVVAHPSSITGATGYNVYVGTSSGNETRQNGDTPISLSSNWTMPAGGLVDGALPPSGLSGVGDDNLSRVTTHPTPGTSPADRVTDYFQDWRDRLVAVKEGVQSSESDGTHRPIFYATYDNLDELTSVSRYDGDGVTVTATAGVPDAPSSSLLRQKYTLSYDEWGQIYRADQYDIVQSGGSAGSLATSDTLSTQLWHDLRGNTIAIAHPGGLVDKFAIDGAGRTITQYTGDGGVLNNPSTWNSYANAASVAGDVVLQQTDWTYDDNDNVILTKTRQRNHDDATNGAGLGVLGDASTGPKARVYNNAFYYDAVDRLTDSVDVGTNGGSNYSRDPSVPSSSDTVRVSHIDYNDAGWAATVTDPKGNKTHTVYDMLGRATRTIAGWDGTSDNPTLSANANQTTDYTYDGDDHVLLLKAWNVAGTNAATYQETQYVFATSQTSGSSIDSNDLISSVKYPDKSTGNPGSGTSYAEVFTYNGVGDLKTLKDRNGTVHSYGYDSLGRSTSDTVTTFGAGVDNYIQRIDTSYDSAGKVYEITSYTDTNGASIDDQIRRIYNGLGQLTTEYQEHYGAVNTSTSPKVQYGYSEMVGGANHSRLVSITYPDGRVITRDYNSGIDDAISRPSAVGDGTGTNHTVLESYKYIGLDTIVEQMRPQNSTKLTFIQQSGDTLHGSDGGDQYVGLDRFGQVADVWWLNYSGTSVTGTVDRFQYAYDADGNTLYKRNLVDSSFSELYHINSSASGDNSGAYDKLGRLTDFRRGTLSSSGNNGSSLDTVATLNGNTNLASIGESQNFGLDAQGNQSSLTTDTTTQTKTTDQQNELTAITTGTNTATLSYDNNGNLTNDGTVGQTYYYDAWNRMVAVYRTGDGYVRLAYYDGEDRRIFVYGTFHSNDLYYSAQWQVIQADDETGNKAEQNVWSGGWGSYVDSMVERDQYRRNGVSITPTRYYAEQDMTYNVTSLTDTSGTVVDRIVYSPYGQFVQLDSSFSGVNTNAANIDWKYFNQGGRFDAATGLTNFRFRDYDARLGRWMQPEPFGTNYIDGTNLYKADEDAPTGWVDATGLASTPNYGPTDANGQPQGLPPAPNGGAWKPVPDGSPDRGGHWEPTVPNNKPGYEEPTGSWDEDGQHWDYDPARRKNQARRPLRERYNSKGQRLTPEEAHNPPPKAPPASPKQQAPYRIPSGAPELKLPSDKPWVSTKRNTCTGGYGVGNPEVLNSSVWSDLDAWGNDVALSWQRWANQSPYGPSSAIPSPGQAWPSPIPAAVPAGLPIRTPVLAPAP